MENLFLKALRRVFAKPDPAPSEDLQGPSPVEEPGMTDTPAERFENVPSPFCGIASDDLTLEVRGIDVRLVANGDPVTQRGFEVPVTDLSPKIQGHEVSLEEAVVHAAGLLKASKLPVFSGFGTDVNETRAAFSLIDRSSLAL